MEKSIEQKQKQQFAVSLLKCPVRDKNSAFMLACEIFGDDTSRALQVASTWPTDPEVLGYMESAIEEQGDMHFLPTKADLARLAWTVAIDDRIHVEDKLKAMRLYGDIRGFIEKQAINVNNSIVNNKVMLVKDHGSSFDWEHAVVAQQARLIEDAADI